MFPVGVDALDIPWESGIEVRLFGEISVRHNQQPLQFSSTKALELLSYLLLHCDRSHTREALAEVLWPAGRPAVSRRYLRQALWRLGGTLKAYNKDASAPDIVLMADPEWVRVDLEASWWLDVRAFDHVYAQTRDTPAHRLSDQQADTLDAALGLYRGELMATWYHDWCIVERDRRQLIYLSMLEQLMGYCETRGLHARGLDYGWLVLQVDPTRENAHYQLMRLHYSAGDRASALRQFRRCADVLDREFGIAPSTQTAALHEQIQAGLPIEARSAFGGLLPPGHDVDAVAGLHARLDQIQAELAALHDLMGRHPDDPFGTPPQTPAQTPPRPHVG